MALFGNGSQGFSLKALLEDPNLQNPPKLNTGQLDLKKGGVRHGGFLANANSAFLGPNLWERHGQDNKELDLEYMDLDEFLSENGIPVNPDDADDTQTINLLASTLGQSPSASPVHSPSSPIVINPVSPDSRGPISPCLNEGPSTSSSGSRSNLGVYMPESPIRQSAISPLSFQSNSPGSMSPSAIERCLLDDSFGVTVKVEMNKSASLSSDKKNKLPEVTFDVNESDLSLVTIPGQENFDPKRRKFSEEELKPQPIIKKSKKVFVEDTMKDDRYWQRRKKNNIAAKRSRDARRVKENQIAMRAAFLEQENDTLKEELEKIQRENEKLIKRLAKYESV